MSEKGGDDQRKGAVKREQRVTGAGQQVKEKQMKHSLDTLLGTPASTRNPVNVC